MGKGYQGREYQGRVSRSSSGAVIRYLPFREASGLQFAFPLEADASRCPGDVGFGPIASVCSAGRQRAHEGLHRLAD